MKAPAERSAGAFDVSELRHEDAAPYGWFVPILGRPCFVGSHGRSQGAYPSPIFSAAMKASCGISTLPNSRIFFLPFFCFSKSLRLRVASPP